MSRYTSKNASASSYTVTVWAGTDMYTQLRLPAMPYRDDPSAEYEEVSNRIRGRIEGEFGAGVSLVRRDAQNYEINVDEVII